MKNTKYITIPFVIFGLLLLFSCKKDELKMDVSKISDVVITSNVTNITATSATCGGNVTDDGGATVKARGVCWSTSQNPTISDSHTTDGTGIGNYTSYMTDMSSNTTYYVRAYATNSAGTSYGAQREFTTQDGLPTVTTNDVTNITATSATCGGNVTDDGGFTVTERGVCWSTSQNPTTSDSHTTDGTGIGNYTSYMTDMTSNTTYYVRSYATNSIGTAYGEQKTFKTPIVTPAGAVAGLFSVSATQQVFFSQGNLQYQASTNTWRFAENQWDYIGDDNSNISSSYSGWIDLFGWGTSGYNHGAVCYQPYSTSHTYSDYYAYGSSTYNLNDQTGQADWGYNAISNGGNTTNTWRTLTSAEWVYVFNTRNTASGIRYAKAIVNGIHGVILLPDDWSTSYYTLSSTNSAGASYKSNSISLSDWTNSLEAHGAVFLPAAGYRSGTNVNNEGDYWSASYIDSDGARYVFLYDGGLNPGNWGSRQCRRSVRLVCPAEN